MRIRKEMTTSDNVRLVVIKDNGGQFWWFNFHQKNKLFGHSDGRGNAQKYYEEVKRFLG